MKVIGGVGGNLNHSRLTGIKPKSSYQEAIRARAAARRDAKKKQRERDKALGSPSRKLRPASASRRRSARTIASSSPALAGAAMGYRDVLDGVRRLEREGLTFLSRRQSARDRR